MPPASRVVPPVTTRAQELPFGSLSWEDFERLCLRLASREARVEHCQLYGVRGQDQAGIDLYARPILAAKFRVYQCKREKNFGPAKIKEAVGKFREGTWFEKADTLVLCTQESLEPTALAEEFERQATALRERGIALLAWDSRQLSSRLKQLPEIVDDFFGRAWVREFCGHEQADRLGDRLDAARLAEFRREMGRFYGHVFNVQDPGLLIPNAPGAGVRLADRYIIPDVLDRRSVGVGRSGGTGPRDDGPGGPGRGMTSPGSEGLTPHADRRPGATETIEARRPVGEWLAANDRTAVLGGPGSGKSTLLRFLAIDLLSEEPRLAAVTEKWGTYLPVWVPFPRWTKSIAETGPSVSLTDMLRQWLVGWDEGRLWALVEQALRDHRLLLLVDGLDEYANEEAAGIALDRLRVFVEQRRVPAILASRPHGFRRLGIEHSGWEVGELGDFTPAQQERLAQVWYACRLTHLEGPDSDAAEVGRRAAAASEEFLVELAGSPDFQELAKVPLLLNLLILRRMHDGYLPTSRFKAYEQLVDLLTAKHPARRRKAAEITDPGLPAISDEDARRVLARLAYHVQSRSPEGLIDHDEARAFVRTHLRDPDEGFGFAEREARDWAGRLLEVGVETTGILVSRSQTEIGYFHRTAQEYLAACYLAELPLEEQVDIVQSRSSDPRWREVLLCLFHLTRRPADLQACADAIRAGCPHPIDRMAGELLLCEMAFGSFNCPIALTRELASTTFALIEAGSWVPHREELLRRVLDGLRSARVRGMVEARIPRWFPSRLTWRSGVFEAMAGWRRDPDVLDCLLRGMLDEDVNVQRSAARSLADLAAGDPAVGDRVAHAAGHAEDPMARAAAVAALARGWPDHIALPRVLDAARGAVSPELRVAAIAARIGRGGQTAEDREELIRLGAWEGKFTLDFHWRTEIPAALLAGWPGEESLKRVCLAAAGGHHYGEGWIEQEFAQHILLEGYPGDEDVAAFCVNELQSQYPFLMLRLEAWRLLAKSFRDHPRVVEAVDAWVAKHGYQESEIALASRVGRTDTIKRTLLGHLDGSPVPHWAAEALLEGWGTGDAETSSRLQAVAFGPADRASRIALYLPEIIGDKPRCRERLLTLLKDPACSRVDCVLLGLEKLGTRDDVEAVDTILALLPQRPAWRTDRLHDVYGHLIRIYAWDPRIRELAKKELAERGGSHVSVARAYGDDPVIRGEILRYANPLPASLRVRIARGLRPGAGSEDFLLPLLRLYDHEPDGIVKTEASIAYHLALRSLDKVTDADLEALRGAIIATGPDFEARRQAAFAGLVALDRIGEFESIRDGRGLRPELPANYGVTTNLALLRLILQHWDQTRLICWEAFRQNEVPLWEMLCTLADEYPKPRDEAIRYFEGRADAQPKLNELRFLARVRPGSGLLLGKCMKSLQIGEKVPRTRVWEAIAAAEILGAQFQRDEGVYRRIAEACAGPWFPEEAVLALCEGWPESPELDRAYRPGILKDCRTLLSIASATRLVCLKGPTEEIEEIIGRVLAHPGAADLREAVVPPIVRRLRVDDRLAARLVARLFDRPSPTEKTTLPRLIASSVGLSPDLRSWILAEIDQQVGKEELCEIGFDLITGTNRAVWHGLLDALG